MKTSDVNCYDIVRFLLPLRLSNQIGSRLMNVENHVDCFQYKGKAQHSLRQAVKLVKECTRHYISPLGCKLLGILKFKNELCIRAAVPDAAVGDVAVKFHFPK